MILLCNFDLSVIGLIKYKTNRLVEPKSKVNFAFIMHSLSWFAMNGTDIEKIFPPIRRFGGGSRA